MRRQLLSLLFGFLVILMGPAGVALADGHGNDHSHDQNGDNHHGDDHHDGDHHGDHHDGGHHDGDHNDDDHNGDCNGGGHDGNHGEDHSGGTTCPCVTAFPLFSNGVNGQYTVTDCIDSASNTSLITTAGIFFADDTVLFCSIGSSPPFISITAAQALVCRTLLQRAAASQHVACHPSPE
jgi:hypothetical protein